jgi:hypothetical protein
MRKTQKALLALMIAVSCGTYSASAQIYVHIRPVVPVIVRTEAPSPHHVWVREEWRENGGQYEYAGGHWAEPPHEGYRYTEGHWDHSNHGDRWHQGGWHDGGRHGGGYGRGEHEGGGHGHGNEGGGHGHGNEGRGHEDHGRH